MTTRSSVDRVPAQCSEGHGFDSSNTFTSCWSILLSQITPILQKYVYHWAKEVSRELRPTNQVYVTKILHTAGPSMLDFLLMLWLKLPVVDRIKLQSNKFAMGVWNEAKGDSKLNDSCDTASSIMTISASGIFNNLQGKVMSGFLAWSIHQKTFSQLTNIWEFFQVLLYKFLGMLGYLIPNLLSWKTKRGK